MRKKILPLILVSVLLLVACDLQINPKGLDSSKSTATFTPIPPPLFLTPATLATGPTRTPLPTATHAPENDPPTPTPTPTWAPPASPNCIPPSSHGELEETAYEDTPNEILAYLNDGASPEELAVAMMHKGLNLDQQPVVVDDLTNDGLYDVVVMLLNTSAPPQGSLLIYTCQGGEYTLSHIEISEIPYSVPTVVRIQDMDADGQDELIIASSSCGAHTCFEDMRILSWTGERFENRLEGSTIDLPYPNAKLIDYDRDYIYDFEVTGTAVGSVGAGPQRDRIKVWTLVPDTGKWVFASESYGPSDFRIHIIHDADAAMRRGEYQIAFLLYQQVIEDDTLKDWMNPDYERSTLSAYAHFKQVVAKAFMGEIEEATDIYASMNLLFRDQDQQIFAVMAMDFLEGFAVGGEAEGCQVVEEFAELYSNIILDNLGQSVYGYTNPNYTAQDICP
ncbi:MAG: hypothetical protein PVF83_01530 [Anaerolineales bacterium]